MKEIVKKANEFVFNLECKCAEKIARVKDNLQNQNGISTLELLSILGVAIILIGLTFGVARDPITTWWSSKVMPFWQ